MLYIYAKIKYCFYYFKLEIGILH